MSCRKLIDIELPIDKNTSEQVFSTAAGASAAVSGIYATLANDNAAWGSSISVNAGILADELFSSKINDRVYRNDLAGAETWDIWDISYKNIIFRCNSAIEGVTASKELPNETRQILIGELKFIRSLNYFYLVNLYGDVPLVLTTDFKTNANISRTPAELVYQQIIKDLKEAQAGLKDNYFNADISGPTYERIRPNKAAATALLARVYLYNNDWANAEIEATKVIDDSKYSLTSLDSVFLKNSNETIFSLQPNLLEPNGRVNTLDGKIFLPRRTTFQFYEFSEQLMAAFESGDKRLENWLLTTASGKKVPYKYKMGENPTFQESTEYTVVLRLAEQYLIRAEARAHQDKITGTNGAEADLNKIRLRAQIGETTAIESANAMLEAIGKERFTELFTEWGHRWLDLKRTGKINDMMEAVTPLKGGIWTLSDALMPIPYTEFSANPSLIGQQNPGYREQP